MYLTASEFFYPIAGLSLWKIFCHVHRISIISFIICSCCNILPEWKLCLTTIATIGYYHQNSEVPLLPEWVSHACNYMCYSKSYTRWVAAEFWISVACAVFSHSNSGLSSNPSGKYQADSSWVFCCDIFGFHNISLSKWHLIVTVIHLTYIFGKSRTTSDQIVLRTSNKPLRGKHKH